MFHWLWDKAIPTLLGPENVCRIQLVLTDGDAKMYMPFEGVKGKHYPSAIHGLCGFHLVSQPLSRKSFLGKDKPAVKVMIST